MGALQLGVFASGRGSNFEAILQAIGEERLCAEVKLLLSNNPEAGALETAEKQDIPAVVINRKDFTARDLFVNAMLSALTSHHVDFVVLAGYMKMIPPEVVQAFHHRVLNIHPALLPSFGGKGMYGHYVHEAVLDAGCKVSGVTVHLVDEQYDRGPIVAQVSVPVMEGDTADSLAARILVEEHRIFAETLQLFAEGRVDVQGRRVMIKQS